MRTRALLPLVLVLLLVVPVRAPATADEEVLPRGVWPLTPRPDVVRRFDPPDGPYAAGHRGVDLLGRTGQPVRTALTGTVSFAGGLAGRGVVSVRHGGLRTTYEPVTATVHVGDHVPAGARIGVLQVGPSHCRPRHCLHWGLIRGRTYLDPLLLVGAGPVRLLPLDGSVAAAARVPDRALAARPSTRPWLVGATSAATSAARVGTHPFR